MSIGDEIYTDKSNGYVSDNIATMKKKFPDRKYKQTSVFTHTKPLDDTLKLKDFNKIIFVTRVA